MLRVLSSLAGMWARRPVCKALISVSVWGRANVREGAALPWSIFRSGGPAKHPTSIGEKGVAGMPELVDILVR